MEDLKAMVKAVMDSLIEVTQRAVHAEDLEEALRANIEKAREDAKYWQTDADYWRGRCEETKAKLDAMKKEVEQLRAKLNAIEGLEAADRGAL